ncbi:unnamed protein product [Pieris macdunnoughi]|uniref:Uncharacterized protein n=1 Tax=Pieris macdunnoughi TaxID=345717 RepID=A0A821QQQ8_9NEOP|nr:unnamed protein product [Pieris macdunnoughi]
MLKQINVILICYICFLLFVVDQGAGKTKTKRYLGFRNVSRFFLRINHKANMVRWNQIFAQALGFRMNWDDPPDTFHWYHHFTRRSLYNGVELLLDSNGLSGYHCVRRAVCEMNKISDPYLLYHKILKIIFRRQQELEKWYNHTKEDCISSINSCPFSFLDISPYTDL